MPFRCDYSAIAPGIGGRLQCEERTPRYDDVEADAAGVLRSSGQAWREAVVPTIRADGRWNTVLPSTLGRYCPMDRMCAATIAIPGHESASVPKGAVRDPHMYLPA